MRKGLFATQNWLAKIISLCVVVLIAVASYFIIVAYGGRMAESMAVGSSAEGLAAAINRINDCINEQQGEPDGCREEIEVRISVLQDLPDQWNPSSGYDPLWVIYHDYCVSRNESGENVEQCRLAPEDQTVLAADCECNSLWDSGIFAERCINDLCWGLIENECPGRSQVSKEALDRLKPFYILDPCYAVVKVREKPAGKIDICFEEKLDGPGAYNWCYSDDKQCGWLGLGILRDSRWPHDDHAVFDATNHPSHKNKWCDPTNPP